MIIPTKCNTEDMVIVISSTISGLKFESNQLPDDEFIVTHNPTSNQYIICHEMMKFILTISGPKFQSKDIYILDKEQRQAYRVSANTAKGTVDIKTNPNNATVMFPSLNDATYSSNQPITNITGTYKIKIIKPEYKSIDTVIVIPRDATNEYEFELIPEFSQVRVELETWGNTIIEEPPVLIIDGINISLDAITNPNVPRKYFYEGVEYHKLYENDIIPLPPGNHEIEIITEKYTPSYEQYLYTENGKVKELKVRLEPLYGYITFIDEMNAEGAEVYVNGKLYGNVPIFKERIKVGENIITVRKPGFMMSEEEIIVDIKRDEIQNVYIPMEVSKEVDIKTNPPKALVKVNGEQVGFTPTSIILHAGHHEIQIKKTGYSTVKLVKYIEETSSDEDSISVTLLRNYPLNITSEKEGLEIILEPLDNKTIELEGSYKTQEEKVLVPYGSYELTLKDDGKPTFIGKIKHRENRNQNLVVPSYSRTSFQYLTGDFVNIENFEASFGRSAIFPNSGLSTSLINVQYNVFEINGEKFETITPFVFFLNWDWRLGGSIFNQLDVCVLGRVKWSPGLKITNFHLSDDYYDASMWSYFYGIEISSRINYFNLHIKIGKQIMNGEVNLWDYNEDEYGGVKPFSMDNFIISIGFTLNGKVYKNNNMLRLWKKPLAVKL
jgi:hypothetical protein